MSSSGTYAYNPSIGEVVLHAYNLCQIRPAAIVQEHMASSRTAMNLLLFEWSNMQVNLWKVDLVTVALVEGQATYNVDAKTIVMLDTYVTIDDGVAPPIDRIILPISRSEYASYPNKEQEGFPTVYWFDRLISPTVTIWPVPDGSSAQYLKYYRVTQVEDAGFRNGQTLDLPIRWIPAFVNGLAVELARIWVPTMVAGLQPFADRSYQRAANQDVETGNFYVSPNLSSYTRP